jgi:S1-C subfamily serine protease
VSNLALVSWQRLLGGAKQWGVALSATWLLAGCGAQIAQSAFETDFNCHEEVAVEEGDAGRFKVSGCGRSATYQCVTIQYQALCTIQHVEEEASTLRPGSGESIGRRPDPVSADPELRVENKGGEPILRLELRLDRTAMLKLTAAPDKQSNLVQLKLIRREPSKDADSCRLDFMVNGQVLKVPPSIASRDGNVLAQRVQVGRDIITELALAEKISMRACQARYGLDREQVQKVRDFMDRYQEEMAWKAPPREGGTAGMLAPTGGWPAWSAAGAPPSSVSGAALDARTLFKKLGASVFLLEATRADGLAQGSAVAISTQELATNCHVVQGALKLVLKQGKLQWPARVVRADPKTDRCVLESDQPQLETVAGVRSYDSLEVGEKVYTLGSPVGLELTLSDGIISGRRDDGGFHYVQTTAPISPGSSGGGLFDAHGNLIGVTTLVLTGRERLNQALNFAIPADAFWQK